MKRVLHGAVVSLLVGVLVAADTYPVTVRVTVTDSSGFVRGLRANEFTLTEGGRQQAIASVTPLEQGPQSFVMLVDVSLSTRTAHYDYAMLMDFFSTFVRKGRDAGSVVYFNETVNLAQNFTDDSLVFATALARLKKTGALGKADTFGALFTVSDFFGKRTGRKIILLVTDGEEPEPGLRNESDVLRRLRDNAIEVYVAVIRNINNPGKKPSQEYKTLTQETGGRLFSPGSQKELAKNLKSLALELPSQYRIDFLSTTPQSGKPRQIKVGTENKKFKTQIVWPTKD